MRRTRGMRGMRVLFFRERKEPKESNVKLFFWLTLCLVKLDCFFSNVETRRTAPLPTGFDFLKNCVSKPYGSYFSVVGEDIILPQNHRQPQPIGRSMTKALYLTFVGTGVLDGPNKTTAHRSLSVCRNCYNEWCGQSRTPVPTNVERHPEEILLTSVGVVRLYLLRKWTTRKTTAHRNSSIHRNQRNYIKTL